MQADLDGVVGLADEHRGGGQAAVEHAAAVAEADGLGDEADEVEAVVKGEAGVGAQVGVEGDAAVEVLEQERGTERGVLHVVLAGEDAGVLAEAGEDLGFALGGATELLLPVNRGCARHEVAADADVLVVDRAVGGEVLLVAVAVAEEIAELVLADEAAELGRAQADRVQRLGDVAHGRAVDDVVADLPVGQLVAVGDGLLDRVVGDDALVAVRLELVLGDVRDEDQRLDAHRALALHVAIEQRLERLRLAVGERVRVVDGACAVRLLVDEIPIDAVTLKRSRVALDLDEVERVLTEDDEIDFVERAGGRVAELLQRPRLVRIDIVEHLQHVIDGLPFPRVRRLPAGVDALLR